MSAYSRSSFTLATLVALLFITSNCFGQKVETALAMDTTLSQAQLSGKKVVVYMFSKEWDSPTKLWEALPKHRVVEQYLSQFTLVEADAMTSKGKEWADNFNVVGIFPAIALLNSDGIQYGYMSLEAPDLVATLSFLLTSEMAEESLVKEK